VIEDHLSYRPRVARETRRLLTALLVAILAIWILARIRFPEEQATPNPVGPLLGQLSPRYRFADLASDLTTAQSRIAAVLQPLPTPPYAALRLPGGVGLVMLAPDDELPDTIARDRASGLAVVRLEGDEVVAAPAVWIPERLDQARYLLAASPGGSRVFAKPVLVNALDEGPSPLWPDRVWTVRGDVELPHGSFVFTGEALLAGLAVEIHGVRMLVPASTVLAEASRLLAATGGGAPGSLGIDVAELTPALARATAAAGGVIVSHVDPRGPAAATLSVGDVIETVDGAPVRTWADWQARTGRVIEGQSVMAGVRRQGASRDVALVAGPTAGAAPAGGLGLSLRRSDAGAEVMGVDPGTAAAAAGLLTGDVVVQFGAVRAPSPAAIRQAFAALPAGGAIVAGIARGTAHHVVALEKDASGDR
jgi:hypothetical protein